VRAYRGTFPYEKALRIRRVWVEPLFAEAKDRHGMRRFRLTASCVKVDPYENYQHESVLKRSQAQGVRRRRSRDAPKEVARIFGVSLPSIKRWLKRRRESGEVEPSPRPGPSARKGALLEQWLPNQFENNPDLTFVEHCESFEEDLGVRVSTATMSRRISSLPKGDWPLKKVSHSPRAR